MLSITLITNEYCKATTINSTIIESNLKEDPKKSAIEKILVLEKLKTQLNQIMQLMIWNISKTIWWNI